MKLRLIILFVLLLLMHTSFEGFAQNIDSTITIKPFEVVENRWNIFTAGTKKQNLKSVLVLPVGFRADDCYMKDLAKVRKLTQETIININ